MGDQVTLVNPAYETAMDLKALLEEQDMVNDGDGEHGQCAFYVSDAAEKFQSFANSVMPFYIASTSVIEIEEY